MSHPQLRFRIVQEHDLKWTVLDADSGNAACFGAETLQGLTELQAQTFATILNEIHPPRAPVAGTTLETPFRAN